MLHKNPKIIIIAPNVMKPPADKLKDIGVIEKSKSFNKDYKLLAKKCGCYFVANENLVCGDDGIHLTAESHKYLSDILSKLIRNIFETNFQG